MRIITMQRLSRAVLYVSRELSCMGFWDDAVHAIDVVLHAPALTSAYGWQQYGGNGEIHIPMSSLAWLSQNRNRTYKSLRDVLRHEYAHAVADTHRGLIRSSKFTRAFGASHESSVSWEFDPVHHVSRYAAEDPSEDFAEVFMEFIRHRGALPRQIDTLPIRRKWGFVRDMGGAISKGTRRWS